MAEFIARTNTATTTVEVRESDEYTKTVLFRITQNERKMDEVYFNDPTHLELLGRFLIKQADEIRTAQEMRK